MQGFLTEKACGEGGIRTLEQVLPVTRLAGEPPTEIYLLVAHM